MKYLKLFNEASSFVDNPIGRYLNDVLLELEDNEFTFCINGNDDGVSTSIISGVKRTPGFTIKIFRNDNYTYNDIKYPVQHAISYLKERGFKLDKLSCPFMVGSSPRRFVDFPYLNDHPTNVMSGFIDFYFTKE